MLKKKAFTLIELLVVISIIALLMSILMPSLSRVKQQARVVVCMSNLRQLSFCAFTYFSEHQSMWAGVYGFGTPEESNRNWFNALRNYYQAGSGGGEVRICPDATKPLSEIGRTPYSLWQGWEEEGGRFTEDDMSSYAFNDWLCNPPDTGSTLVAGRAAKRFWRSIDKIKQADEVPMFIDSLHTNITPTRSDSPPQYSSLSIPMTDLVWNINTMKMVCIERHMKDFVQAVHCDQSVKRIGLRQLWGLRWHKGYTLTEPAPRFEVEAEWMMSLRDW